MGKRYIVYIAKQTVDTGGYGWGLSYEDTPLEDLTIFNLMSSIVGIYTDFQRVKMLIDKHKSYRYQEIEWEE